MSRPLGAKGVRARLIASSQLSLAEVPYGGATLAITISSWFACSGNVFAVGVDQPRVQQSLRGHATAVVAQPRDDVACRKGVDSYRRVALQQP